MNKSINQSINQSINECMNTCMNCFECTHVLYAWMNSRLVVDEDDNGKFRLERVNPFY